MRVPFTRRLPALLLPAAAVVIAISLSLAAPAAFADDPPAPAPAPPAATPTPKDPEKVEAERIAALVARLKSSDLATRRAAAAEAAAESVAPVTSALVHLLSDDDPEVRWAAIDGLGKRGDAAGKKSAASALAARLPRLAGKGGSRADLDKAIEALHDLAQPVSIQALMDDIPIDIETELLRARLMAVANVPAADAIEALITFASRGRRGLDRARASAREALRSATGQDFGADPDVWRMWWKDAEKTFDYGAAAAARREAEERAAAKAAGRAKPKPAPRKPGDPPPPMAD